MLSTPVLAIAPDTKVNAPDNNANSDFSPIVDFTFENIKNCTEAFVTGTFAGIIPVSQLEGRKLESTHSESLVNKIRCLYNKEIQNSLD